MDLHIERSRGDLLDKELKLAQIFIKTMRDKYTIVEQELKGLRKTADQVKSMQEELEAMDFEQMKAEIKRLTDTMGTVGRFLFAASYADGTLFITAFPIMK